MAIPDRFGANEDERIDVTVRNMDEVLLVSEQVIKFCKNRGLDYRRSFFAGLCLEEMAGNVVNHGFPLDNKEHSMDIRVINIDDKLVLRIRDNCAEFKPAKRAVAMKYDETVRNIGIKLVYSLVETVEYQNLLGLNVLTIRI